MVALLVVAHAPFASSLAAVAAHVFPDCSRQLAALDVDARAACDEVQADVRAAVDAVASRVAATQGAGVGAEVLVLVDVLGATPSNAARDAAAAAAAEGGPRVQVIAGVNVPMLWRTLCYAHLTLDELVDRALQGGANGVARVTAALPSVQNQSLPTAFHAQVPHHHQQ